MDTDPFWGSWEHAPAQGPSVDDTQGSLAGVNEAASNHPSAPMVIQGCAAATSMTTTSGRGSRPLYPSSAAASGSSGSTGDIWPSTIDLERFMYGRPEGLALRSFGRDTNYTKILYARTADDTCRRVNGLSSGTSDYSHVRLWQGDDRPYNRYNSPLLRLEPATWDRRYDAYVELPPGAGYGLPGGGPDAIAEIWNNAAELMEWDDRFTDKLLDLAEQRINVTQFSEYINTVDQDDPDYQDKLQIDFYLAVVSHLIDKGGLYGALKRKSLTQQVEANHMPPKAVVREALVPGLSENDMPAVTMEYGDHGIFPSTASGRLSDEAMNALRALGWGDAIQTVENYHFCLATLGSYAAAMGLEIQVKREMFGTKYKEGIDKAIDAARARRLIDQAEANVLKRINEYPGSSFAAMAIQIQVDRNFRTKDQNGINGDIGAALGAGQIDKAEADLLKSINK